MRRLDWMTPGFLGLAGLQQWLVEAGLLQGRLDLVELLVSWGVTGKSEAPL
jgi:hypothetical protein